MIIFTWANTFLPHASSWLPNKPIITYWSALEGNVFINCILGNSILKQSWNLRYKRTWVSFNLQTPKESILHISMMISKVLTYEKLLWYKGQLLFFLPVNFIAYRDQSWPNIYNKISPHTIYLLEALSITHPLKLEHI